MRLSVDKLVHGGAGIGEIDGKMIFVPFSAPGDVLEIEIISDHGNYAEARIVKIIEAAPCRVNPPCPVFGKCGGCQWQHISYDVQLDWKRKILAETFRRIGKIDVDVMPTLASPKQWNYRNRIQLHVDSKGQAGFYRPRSKEVVEFEKCFIVDERLNDQLNSMREEIKFRTKGIALRIEEGPSFLQINTEQNEQLKRTVAEWMTGVPHDSVLELYAGGGNFTFEIAKIAKRVTASEIDIKAVRYALERMKEKDTANVEFICEDSLKTVKKFGSACDVVLLDPPRKGCAGEVGAIAALAPKAVIYISCDPASLARDVKTFGEHGYRLTKSMPVDMFPQTYHIESVNLLRL